MPLQLGELDDLARLNQEIRRSPGYGDTLAHSRAAALVALRFGDGTLNEATRILEAARQSYPPSAALLNDLAVAYLEVAARDQDLVPLLRALDAVDRSLAADSTLVEAQYNRALILERSYLVGSARRAWTSYVAVERNESWRAEGLTHLARVAAIIDGAPTTRDPQQVRDEFFQLLGEWGYAAQRGDVVVADSLLHVAAAEGDSLRALNADGTVLDATAWLAAHGKETTVRDALAKGLIGLATGLRLNEQPAYEESAATLDAAQRSLRSVGFPAIHWAMYAHAVAEANSGRIASAVARLDSIRAEAPSFEPAVIGKALWLRGVIAVRAGNYESANDFYAMARPQFAMAKDRRNAAALSWLMTESHSLAGQIPVSMHEGLVALRGLAPFRQSIYLSNHLITMSDLARAAGLRYAALDITGEALDVIRGMGRGDAVAPVLAARANDLAALGDSAGARAALNEGQAAASRLDKSARRFALAEIDFERGRLWRLGDADSAAVRLDRAERTYRAIGRTLLLPSVYYERAMFAESRGNTVTARVALDSAVNIIENQGDQFSAVDSRSLFYETAENVFDALMKLELDVGRPLAAFAYLERGRAALLRSSRDLGGRRIRVASPRDVAAALPADMLFVTYAVLDDRLVAWWTTHAGAGSASVPISRDSLRSMIQRVRHDDYEQVESDSTWTRLSTLLLGMIGPSLGSARRLSIAPDRELGEVSFAALRNPSTGHYLVDDVSVRTLPSASFLVETRRTRGTPSKFSSALVVGDPALAPEQAGELGPLRGAELEASRVAKVYSGSRLLVGAAARRGTVTGELPNHSVFHFAGHAVFNEDRPDLSYLALAGDSTRPTGRLEAREIARLHLSNVRLVVLSACATMKSRPTRSGPIASLAYTFLRAGVRRSISTLWDISDESVVDLLVGLHERIASGTDPGDALSAAQRAALHSARAELRSPSVWGAFIYTGP
jgi:CHAT domain-containing protein/tetratricopeptide (TPR) repeat protein